MKQYKGEISDFPNEVVEKMLDYQEQEDEIKSVSVLEQNRYNGFRWKNTPEGREFWEQVITYKDFDLFFQKYPRKLIFEKNTAYQAETEDEAEMLLKEAHRQGKKWNSGRSYLEYPNNWENSKTCYCILEGYWARKEYWIEEEGYKIITVKEFFNLTNKTMNNNRFPFKLKEEQARKIISVACGSWKTKLAEKWGTGLLLDGYVEISESFYKEMRKACTKEQNLLFDAIFGADKVEIDFSILNDEDVFYYETKFNYKFLLKGKDSLNKKVDGVCLNVRFIEDSKQLITLADKKDLIELRKATKEEQELYYKHYPQWSLKDAKDGEPVWVREEYGTGNPMWGLYYADGKGSVYVNQQISGAVRSACHYMQFDPNNLPVNN